MTEHGTPTPVIHYVVMALNLWADQMMALGIPFAARQDDGSVGYLSVYETREEAMANNPNNRDIVAIQQCDPQPAEDAAP